MPLIKTVTRLGGKRPLGWIVESEGRNVMILKRTPTGMTITTRKSAYVSINDSADRAQAGWALEPELLRALRTYECTELYVYVPKAGILYTIDAQAYDNPDLIYSAAKTKNGPRLRCVAVKEFKRQKYRVKI
jgi:hypothetical protein